MLEIRSPRSDAEWDRYYDIRYRLLRKPWGNKRGEERKPEDAIADHLAAFSNGTPVGIGMVYDDGGNARIRFIAMEEEYQRKGLGTKLMAALEGLARKKGFKKAILWGDENAVKFYEKLGYKNVGKGPLLNGLLQQYDMEKAL